MRQNFNVRRLGLWLGLLILPMFQTGCLTTTMWNGVAQHDRAKLSVTGWVKAASGAGPEFLIAHDDAANCDVAIPLGSRFNPSPYAFTGGVAQLQTPTGAAAIPDDQLRQVAETPLDAQDYSQAADLSKSPALIRLEDIGRLTSANTAWSVVYSRTDAKGNTVTNSNNNDADTCTVSVLILGEGPRYGQSDFDPANSRVVLFPDHPLTPRGEQVARVAGATILTPVTGAVDVATVAVLVPLAGAAFLTVFAIWSLNRNTMSSNYQPPAPPAIIDRSKPGNALCETSISHYDWESGAIQGKFKGC
jgi:hypothetical protein